MIFQRLFVPEEARRIINLRFDDNPSIHHKFNLKIAKPYIINKNVLDVGCWSGQFEHLSVGVVNSIVGIDPGKEAIAYAKEKIPQAKFKVGNALNLKFADKSFEAVIFVEVIEHLPKGAEKKALKEIYRVLKPGGYLILSTPNNHPLSIFMDPAYFLIGHRHYSMKRVEKMLASSGFNVVNKYQTGGVIRLVTTLLDTIAKHLLNKKIKYPKWVKATIRKEYHKGGFVTNHVIAVKN